MIAGIDIGTSYSSISTLDKDGNPFVIRVSNVPGFGQENSIPSAVFVENDNKIIVGQAAMQVRYKNLSNFKDEFKRDMGTKDAYQLGALSLYPQDLYKELFMYLKKCAESQCGEPITKSYITYPVAFSKAKKDMVKSAASNAGLLNVELIEEPIAAAKSYCENANLIDDCKLLIYDFGGGTFDVSVVQYTNGNFEICGMPGGIENCGGSDINDMLKKDILSQIDGQVLSMINGNADYKQKFYGQISEAAIKIKHILSAAPDVCELIPIGFDTLEYKINRSDFEKMIYALVEETKECVLGTIRQANLSVKDIDMVIPVGGTSKIPLVHKMLKEIFGADKIKNNVDYEFAVCMGAVLFDKAPIEPFYTLECSECGKKLETKIKPETDEWCCDECKQNKMEETQKNQMPEKVEEISVDESKDLIFKDCSLKRRVFFNKKEDEICFIGTDGVIYDHCGHKQKFYEGKGYRDVSKVIHNTCGFGALRKDGTVLFNGIYSTRVNTWKDITDFCLEPSGDNIYGLRNDGIVITSTDLAEMLKVAHVSGMAATALVAKNVNGLLKFTELPWRDIVMIAASQMCIYGLKRDGTIIHHKTKGENMTNMYLNFKELIMIDAGVNFVAGLRNDGTVVIMDDNGQDLSHLVTDWNNITSIACGDYHILGLKKDGACVAVPINELGNKYGQCDVQMFADKDVIIEIIAHDNRSAAILKNGRVVYTTATIIDQKRVLFGRLRPDGRYVTECHLSNIGIFDSILSKPNDIFKL